MPVVFGTQTGPTGGAQAIRDGAGRRLGTPQPAIPFITLDPSMATSTLQSAISSGGPNRRFAWTAGTYRITTTLQFDQAGQQHHFSDATVLKGSTVVPTWTSIGGSRYQSTGNAENFSGSTPSDPNLYLDNPPAGTDLEAYYIDDVMLYPVALTTHVDTPLLNHHSRVDGSSTIGLNPAGHVVEKLGAFFPLIDVTAANVAIRGLRAMHYATGAVRLGPGADGAIMEDCEFAYGRFYNFQIIGDVANKTLNARLSHCTFRDAGRENMLVDHSDGLIVEFCELHGGNRVHFGGRKSPDPLIAAPRSEGNARWTNSVSTTFRSNWVHDNDGPGLWPATLSSSTTIEDSVIEDNFGAGVHCGDASTVTIRRNYIANNTKDGNQPYPHDGSVPDAPTVGGWSYRGGGIWHGGSGLTATANEFFDNKHASVWVTDDGRNLVFDHNYISHWDSNGVFEYLVSYRDALVPPTVGSPMFAVANNVFDLNEYHVRAVGREDTGSVVWFLASGGLTFTQWRQGFIGNVAPGDTTPAMHDPNSLFLLDLPPTSGGPVAAAPASETDTALPITVAISQPINQVESVGQAVSITLIETQTGTTQIIPGVAETDTVQTISVRRITAWSNVATATTFSLVGDITVVLLIASEVDSAFALQGRNLRQVTETDSVHAIAARRRLGWAGPVLVTTLTTGGVVPVVTVGVSQVSEQDFALAFGETDVIIGIAQVEESDFAFAATGGNVAPPTPERVTPVGAEETVRQPVRKPWRPRVANQPRDIVRR